jgi:hypothetical protein
MEGAMQFVAIGPVRTWVEKILDDGTGPIEDYRPYLDLDAESRADASRQVLRSREFRDLVEEAPWDGRDPRGYFVLLRAPEHPDGCPVCDIPWSEDPDAEDPRECPYWGPWNERMDAALARLDKRVDRREP